MSTSGGTTVGTTRAQCSCRSSSGLPGVECLGGGPHVLREGPPDRRGHRPLICCGLGLDRLAKIGRYPDHQRALRLRLAFLRLGGWHVANDTKSATRLGGYSRTESPAQRLSARGTCNQNRIARDQDEVRLGFERGERPEPDQPSSKTRFRFSRIGTDDVYTRNSFRAYRREVSSIGHLPSQL